MIKEINKVLKIEFELEPIVEEDLELIKSFVDIILSNPVSLNVESYKYPLSVQESFEYSIKFFKSINNNYVYKLINAYKTKNIKVRKSKNYDDVAKVIYDGKSNIKYIDLPVIGAIHDSYSLTHEMIHYVSLDIKNVTSN